MDNTPSTNKQSEGTEKEYTTVSKKINRHVIHPLPKKSESISEQQAIFQENFGQIAKKALDSVFSPQNQETKTYGKEVPDSYKKVIGYLLEFDSPSEVLETLQTALNKDGTANNRNILTAIHNRSTPTSTLISVREAIYEDHIASVVSAESAKFGLKWWRIVNNEICRRSLDELEKHKEEQLSAYKTNQLESFTGIFTKAMIAINGKYYYTTETRQSGEGYERSFPEHPAHLTEKLKISASDAEIATLKDIKGIINNVKGFRPFESINIDIFGLVGACDGCDYRIKKFAESIKELGLCDQISINAYYFREPKTVPRGEGIEEISYGREERAIKVRTQKGRFFVEPYS
jgi:hypothetical protein